MEFYTVAEIFETDTAHAEIIDINAFSNYNKAFEYMEDKYHQMLNMIEGVYKDAEDCCIETNIESFDAEIYVYPYGIDNKNEYIIQTYSIDKVKVKE